MSLRNLFNHLNLKCIIHFTSGSACVYCNGILKVPFDQKIYPPDPLPSKNGQILTKIQKLSHPTKILNFPPKVDL